MVQDGTGRYVNMEEQTVKYSTNVLDISSLKIEGSAIQYDLLFSSIPHFMVSTISAE